MQFKHPELLYALFLLLIPIIVHLFQLRKFQKIAFTNVAFLKEATLKTRKSSQIKKWLILITRLLLFAAIILAFAQPFTSKTNTFKTKKETVIYIDNSFSMQAKGNQGELLKRAITDIISNVPENEKLSIITNDKVLKNTSIKTIKNDLLQLEYSSNQLQLDAALLKCNTLFSKEKSTIKNLVFISDFQTQNTNFNPKLDSLTNLHLVKLKSINSNNVSLDSAYITKSTVSSIELKVLLKNNGILIDNLPVSLFNNDTLIAKTSLSINTHGETTFSIPTNQAINGKLTINDNSLQFDNNLFFNINIKEKISVLSINNGNDSFLKRIYTNDEFNYTSTVINQLNYNIIEDQNLIILNELNTIPNALSSSLKQFTDQGGSIILIPSVDINNQSYNTLLSNYESSLADLVSSEKRITTINYSHPLYSNDVFEKQVSNFQYPKVNSYYPIVSNNAASILKYEDGSPFILKSNNAYIITSSINNENSNFKSSPLIVPTLYNVGKQSFRVPELYYTIGKENNFEVETQLQQDDILTLVNNGIRIIPRQKYFNKKVSINTSEIPSIANTYIIKSKEKSIKNVSFNYSRNESKLVYNDLSNLKNVTLSNSITEIFNTIKSDTKVNALWKWFIIFALALLIIEMLILKYFK